jgi:hypothetical protein
VPVIWHDNYVVYGDEARPVSRRIADMTAAEFRLLAPINGGAEAGGDADEALLGTSPASTMSLASLDSACTASSASSRLLRKHKNDTPAAPHEPTLRTWRCEEEDHFPTLAEVRLGVACRPGQARPRTARPWSAQPPRGLEGQLL